MKSQKSKIGIIALFIVFLMAGKCSYGQGFDYGFDYWGKSGNRLPLLTQTYSSPVWAGFYPAIGVSGDTANPTTTLEIFHKKANMRIRQTGLVTQVSMYIHDAANVTNLRIRIWRPTTTTTNSSVCSLVVTSDNLASQLSNGSNTITLTNPLSVQEGDMYSVYYAGTTGGIQLTDNAGGLGDSTRTFTDYQTDTTSKNWGLGTASTRSYRVRFYMSAPMIVLIGNSIIDGAGNATPAYCSGASNLNYQTYDRRNQIGYLLCQNNYTYQNMGISSQGAIVHIQPRFTADVTNLHPRIVVIEGGTNDLAGGAYATAISNAIKKMIDSAVANSEINYVIGILPRNGFTNNQQKTADSINTILTAYCLTKTNSYFIDTRTALGVASDSGTAGNKWNLRDVYNASDYLHPSVNGNCKIAGLIFSHHKTQYAVNDTVQCYISNQTTLTDTARGDLQDLRITCKAFNAFGVDSVYFQYRINSGSVTSSKMSFQQWTSTFNGMTFNDTIAVDTSLVDAGDTFSTRYIIYGYNNKTTDWSTVAIYDRSYQPEFLSLYARYSVKPASYICGIQNRLIYNLKQSKWQADTSKTLWQKMDVFYVLAVNNQANSLLNWVVDSNNCVNVSSYPFTANIGYEGNGSSGYLNTQFKPSTDATNYTLNSASIGVYILENVKEDKTDVGASTVYLQSYLTANNFTYHLNGGGANHSNTDSRGLFIGSRLASNSIFAFKNNDSLSSSTSGSTALPSAEIAIGGYGASFYSSKQIALVFMGAGFSKQDCINISTAVNKYMTELGINKY